MSDIRKPIGRPFVIFDGKPYFDLNKVNAGVAVVAASMILEVPIEEVPATTEAFTEVIEFLGRVVEKANSEIADGIV